MNDISREPSIARDMRNAFFILVAIVVVALLLALRKWRTKNEWMAE